MSIFKFPALLIHTISFVALLSGNADAQYGSKITSFCASKVGLQVGSGECAHLATEALRVAGAEFLRTGMADSPASGDYTWGTRIKRMELSGGKVTDSNTSNKCQPGDIIQYRLGSSKKTHHTSIVASVNSSGYPTQIYEENWNSKRYVTKNSTDLIQLLKDRGGYLQIFRAKAPVSSGRTEFTIVNNSSRAKVSFKLGTSSYQIGQKNTADGFRSYYSTSPTITVDGVKTTVSHRRGYEFYTSGSAVKLRAISP